jgi:hypothetical protein
MKNLNYVSIIYMYINILVSYIFLGVAQKLADQYLVILYTTQLKILRFLKLRHYELLVMTY